MLKESLEKIARIGRTAGSVDDLDVDMREKLRFLRENGYVILDHLVDTEEFGKLKQDYVSRIERDLDIEFPCLAQSKIDPERDKDLIESGFLGTPEMWRERGITFDREDVGSYDHMVETYAPSTLKMSIPSREEYFDVWLDPDVIHLVQAYMGFVPVMVEAYIRRNFPARFKVMNHLWHRDVNHSKYLLKAFIFFSDCSIANGPHHYISGSIGDPRLAGKEYYTDEEVRDTYPEDTGREIVSVVKAGTIILEDTRGLHKAGVPDEGYRDLGYSVFIPPIALKKRIPMYNIENGIYARLSEEKKRYIPKGNILR